MRTQLPCSYKGLKIHKEDLGMYDYEVMFLVGSELAEDALEKVTKRIGTVITKNEGSIISLNDLGTRNLAYKINKKSQGRYFLCRFSGPGALVAELERNLRLDESIMRFMVVHLDKKALAKEKGVKEEKKKPIEASKPAKEQEEVTQ
jgi:small subunit ribosomal protein S6